MRKECLASYDSPGAAHGSEMILLSLVAILVDVHKILIEKFRHVKWINLHSFLAQWPTIFKFLMHNFLDFHNLPATSADGNIIEINRWKVCCSSSIISRQSNINMCEFPIPSVRPCDLISWEHLRVEHDTVRKNLNWNWTETDGSKTGFKPAMRDTSAIPSVRGVRPEYRAGELSRGTVRAVT